MKKPYVPAGLGFLLILMSLSCGKGQVYKKGDLEIEIVKTEWNYIYAEPGHFKLEGGALVVVLNINHLGSGDIPNPKMSVRTATGTPVDQGTTRWVHEGRTAASIHTF